MVFPVVMYGCENWTMKKAEYQRIDAFWTVVLEKTLESFLDCKRSNQSVLKEINPKYSLEGLKLKLQYFGYLVKSQFIGKDPDAGKDWRQKEKGMTKDEMVGWHHRLNGHEFEQTLGDGEEQGSLVCCSPWDHWDLGSQRIGHDWVTEQQHTNKHT